MTARSIPRQFRQELKNQEETETPTTSTHNSLDGNIDCNVFSLYNLFSFSDHKDKSHVNGASDHIPKAKNTIEFFENLVKQKD